jgi:hypothetical protein
MMKLAALVALVLLPAVSRAAGDPRHKSVESMTEDDLIRLMKHPPYISKARLPRGYKIGRCLFVFDGKTLISDKCAYQVSKGGGFLIEGPRQIYDGIDYPDAHGSIAAMVSTDYWARIFKDDDDGAWTGYGNEWDIRGVNGQLSDYGALRRKGACWVNDRVRVCLWKK